MYMYMCQKYPVYTHVREFLATKGITIGVLLYQDKGVGSRMPIFDPVDCHTNNSCSIDLFQHV